MTQRRSDTYKAGEVGTYHCISRCVRRAFLCGDDAYSGNNFEHRRLWIQSRLKFLTEIFAVELLAYTVMMTHLHSMQRNRPDIAASWSDKEVARRWLLLFPGRRTMSSGKPEPTEEEIEELSHDGMLMGIYRDRLSNLSWFNRCLNEWLAKKANREDECTGRFWEGRFKCQRVHDVGALLTCSAYIDLNPIRAGIAKTPEQSDFTSIQDRIAAYKGKNDTLVATPRLLSVEELSEGTVTTEQYLALVDETGRVFKEGKGRINPELEGILTRINVNPEHWVPTTSNYHKIFRCHVGSITSLISAAQNTGKAWLHGMGAARRVFG